MRITLGQVFIAIVLSGLSYAKTSKAQAMLDKPITISINNLSLGTALKKLEKNADIKFVYSKSIIQTTQDVSIESSGEKLASVLNRLLLPNGIEFEVINDRIVLVKKPIEAVAPVTGVSPPVAANTEMQVITVKGAAKSSGRTLLSAPPNFPIGVRTASTIYALGIPVVSLGRSESAG